MLFEIRFYPPLQKTTGLPVDECTNDQYATARCRPEAEADNRVIAEGEEGYYHGTTGLPVWPHFEPRQESTWSVVCIQISRRYHETPQHLDLFVLVH